MRKTLDITANAPTPDVLNLFCTAEIEAAAGENKRPKFSMMAYSGDAMRPDGWFSQVIIDLSGLKSSGQQIPALLQHDPSQIVGQTDAISIDASGVLVKGSVTAESDDPVAKRVMSHARNGFKWQVSVGASIDRKEFLDAGKTAVVNGKQVAGPIVIARAATLREVSFVAIGADPSTSAAIAATPGKEPVMTFDQWLKAKGIDPSKLDDSTKAALKAAFEAEIKAAAPAPAPAPATVQTPAPAPAPIQAGGDLNVMLVEARAEQGRQTEITRIAKEWLAACPDQLDAIEAAAQDAVKSKTPAAAFERLMLRESRPKAGILINAGAAPAAAPAEVIEAALAITAGLSHPEKAFPVATLEAAERRFRHGLGLNELLVLCAEQNGRRRVSSRDVAGLLRAAFSANGSDLQAGGFSTYSLPGILGNTANKFLREGFMAVEQSWRSISAIRNLRDFKQATVYSLSGDFEYEKVGPSGELKHGDADETSYTLQAETYGRMFAITRTDIINDDLGALSAVPRRIGRGGATAINKAFWTEFMDNSTFFTNARSNSYTTAQLGSTTVLGSAGLTSATTKFKKLTDPDGQPMGVSPRILLVPVDLEITAAELVSSTLINTGGSATTEKVPNRNVFQGVYQVVSSTYLSNSSYTGYSATAWYLLADPNDVPVIAVGFLNGRDMPVVESAEADFNVLGIQMRGYHDFGVNLQEYRGGVKFLGA